MATVRITYTIQTTADLSAILDAAHAAAPDLASALESEARCYAIVDDDSVSVEEVTS